MFSGQKARGTSPMYGLPENAKQNGRVKLPVRRARKQPAQKPGVMFPWLRAQAVNATRHVNALRPFRRDEFGTGLAAPTEAHIQAANKLVDSLRGNLVRMAERVQRSAVAAAHEQTTRHFQALLIDKERAHNWVQRVEQIWDFYFELFGQRQSIYGNWLLGCDRIALDCYQYVYLGIGVARSVPTPPPFAYMRTGFSPATYRRGIPLKKLGKELNPFPLVQLPYHRLYNPWTLGAVLHEVSHNIQNDLGLERDVPRMIALRLMKAGYSPFVASVWTRWNREIFADMSGLLLGGPSIVASLMDVVGRSPRSTMTYAPGAAHPTPYLRTFISIELLRRMGFAEEAEHYQRFWSQLYPRPQNSNIPRQILANFQGAIRVVVDAICYQPYPTLGNKSLAQVIRFQPKEQSMIQEAAERIAKGIDPGVIPARFLIGAVRVALEQKMTAPDVITANFYNELARR